MNSASDQGSRRSDFGGHILLATPLVAFLWLYRFLPLQDYPDWLYQASIFSGLIAGHRLPGYSVRPFPVPNSASTIVIGLLCLLFAPEVAGKIFLTIALLTFLAGSVYFVTALDRDRPNPLSYLPFVFAPNFFFLSGYVDYIFSLGLLFVGIGYLTRTHTSARQPRLSVIAILSLLIYFSHMLSWVAWLVAVGAFEVCEFDTPRLKRAAIAVLPSVIMAIWYTTARMMNHDVAVRAAVDGVAVRKVIDGAKAFCLFIGADLIPTPYGVLKLLAVANALSAALVVLLGILWLRWLRAAWPSEAFLALSCLAYLAIFLLAPAWLGGEWWPGDRLLYPAAWIVFASVGARLGRETSKAAKVAIKWTVLAVFAGQMVYLNWFGHAVSGELTRMYFHLRANETAALAQLCDSYRHRAGSPVAKDEAEKSDQSTPATELYGHVGIPAIAPQYHLPYYLWTEQGQPAPIFPTGLLQYRADGPAGHEAIGYDSMLNFGEHSLCGPPRRSLSAMTSG